MNSHIGDTVTMVTSEVKDKKVETEGQKGNRRTRLPDHQNGSLRAGAPNSQTAGARAFLTPDLGSALVKLCRSGL